MDLDMKVSQAIYRVRQIERAVHDPGPWTITYGTHVAPAVRLVCDDRVIFRAHFPDACWIGGPDSEVTLRCAGDFVSARPFDKPEDGEFNVEWTFALPEPVRV